MSEVSVLKRAWWRIQNGIIYAGIAAATLGVMISGLGFGEIVGQAIR